MNFEQRNAAWNGDEREFHQPHSRSGTPRVWLVAVVGNAVHTSWGQLGGKMQVATEYFEGVNLGKSNAIGPAAYALDRAREMCRKKNWEGYREIRAHQSSAIVYLDEVTKSVINFDEPLPLSLSFYKPDNSLSAGLEKRTRAGQTLYTRKRNGMMKVLCKGNDGELKIYSRRMLRQHDDETGTELTWDDRFPFLIHAIEPHMPPGSILLGELVVEEQGHERFDLAQSYIKSLTGKAVADMERSKLWPFFYCWDVAFWNREDLVSSWKTSERFDLVHELNFHVGNVNAYRPIEIYNFQTPEEAVEAAKASDWEGFVVVDPEGIYGDRAYNFKGKPDRPGKFCGKLKPSFEDDFVAIWDPEKGYGERSTKGSRDGGIKSVGLYQYDKKGELVFVANVSSGLTKEMLANLANPKWFPAVWQIEYTGRRYISDGDDTNALDFPRFITVRADKYPLECVNERL